MAGLSDKQRQTIDTARTATAKKFPDIQDTMDKLDSLVDVVLSRNPQLVEKIQGEANRIGIIWTGAAPQNLDARSDAVYQGYRAPGYVRSLIDQLNDPKDPKAVQFWQEFSKSYDPAKHGDILKNAGKVLGQDLSKKLGMNAAPPAPQTNAPTRNAAAAPLPVAPPQAVPATPGDGRAALGQKAGDLLANAGRFSPDQLAAIQDANGKLLNLLDLSWKDENGNGVNNQARDLIARMGVEANTNANNWLKRAPEGMNSAVSYSQYSAPGYFVSMRDQLLNSPQFWKELKKAYDKDMADGALSDRMKTTLQEAGSVLGRNLEDMLNKPAGPGRERNRAQDSTMDRREQVAPPNIFAGRINPADPQTQNYAVIQSFSQPLQEILNNKRPEDLRLSDFSDTFKNNFDRMRREGRAGPVLQAISNYISENVTGQPSQEIMRSLSQNLGLQQAHNNPQHESTPQRHAAHGAINSGHLVENFIAGINNTAPYPQRPHHGHGMQHGLINIFQNAVAGVGQHHHQPEMNMALNVISGFANMMTNKI